MNKTNIQYPGARECSSTRHTEFDVRALKFLWCLVFGTWCFSIAAQSVGPYFVMPGIHTVSPQYPSAATATLATNAINTISGNILPDGLYAGNLAGAWTADSFDYTNDGAVIPAWPDVSGLSNTLNCVGITYSHNICNGRPGLCFTNWGQSQATNQNFVSNYTLNNNVTVFLVVRDFSPLIGETGVAWLFSLGTGTGSFRWADTEGSAAPSPCCAVGGPINLNYGSASVGAVDIMAMSYNGSVYSFWQNGLQEFDGIYSDSQVNAQGTGVGTSGSLFIGGLPIQGDFQGAVSLVLVYTNCLSLAQIQQDNNALRAAYGVTGNNIMLAGDSITANDLGTPASNYTFNVTASFPGWNVGNCGRYGMTSSNQVNYMFDWAPQTYRPSGQNIELFMERINDDNNKWPATVTETYYKMAAAVAHSNYWKFIACTIPSYFVGDSNGTRLTFNNWVRTNWTTYADGICDYAAIPQIGTNGACTNQPTLFGADSTHPTPAAYILYSNVEVQSIQSLLWPTANQFGTLYPSNAWNLALYTNQIPQWGTLETRSNPPGSWPVRVSIWNSNGTFMVQDPAQ